MEVKPGYKQTEVGLIPDEWEVCRLDSLGAGAVPPIKAGPFGSSLTKDTYVPTGFKVYGQEQVIRGDYLYGDYFISPRKYRELESCAVSPGDILFSLVGTAGKLLLLPDDAPAGVINPRLLRFSFDKKRVSSQFFKDLFEGGRVQSFLTRSAQGGTMGVLNAGMLRPVNIPLPPLPEQCAIAGALSEVDALIGALDQLIAKKRDLKQAAMQQLLTGQTRLPGFHGEWEMKRLGDIGQFRNGINKAKEDFGHGFPFANLMDVFGVAKVSTNTSFGLVNSTSAERELYELKKGDVLFVRSSVKPVGVGLTTLVQEDLPNTVFSGFLLRFRDEGRLTTEYKEHCFGEAGFRNRLIASSTVSANTNINQVSLKALMFTFPPERREQTAIAGVLADMDAELAALEQRRAKTRALKQGMMQELLTGRIRLR